MRIKLFKKKRKAESFDLEEAIMDQSGRNFEVLELPLQDAIFKIAGYAVACIGLAIAGRIIFLGVARGDFYSFRALANMNKEVRIAAPRGIITDRFGVPLVENQSAFDVYVKVSDFLKNQDAIISVLEKVLGLDEAQIADLLHKADVEKSDLVLVARDISVREAILLRDSRIEGLSVEDSYRRAYPFGPSLAHVIGYVDREGKGRDGLEGYYDEKLSGEDGVLLKHRNAQGQIIDEYEARTAKSGKALTTTIDAEFQKYFYDRLSQGLRVIDRVRAAGLALNPQNGEVLAMVSLPSFDSNLFTASGHAEEKGAILTSSSQPLFNRIVSGVYSPGSTIKPLVAVAALHEGIVDVQKTIFSKGYIELPNPYNPETPSRFLDWRPQGWVNLYSALARSSNVYFYEVGGGFEDQQGLGIARLRDWWARFDLNKKTGIDLPGEQAGVLPDPEEKEKRTGQIWRIGDTYNVSIGQGDLRITPLELLNYITAIANGGKIYQPFLNKQNQPAVIDDLSYLTPEIKEVQKGMEDGVTESYGTSYLLHDLPFRAAAKTGSAQIQNNAKTNAFFVGYMPAENPELAVLVLIEDAKEGSLNAVPVARDVFMWYYENRIKNNAEKTTRS